MRLALVFAALSVLVSWGLHGLARRRWPRLARGLAAVVLLPTTAFMALRALAWIPGPVASAAPVTLRPGVSYERLALALPSPRVAHVLRVALSTPGLRLALTRPSDRTRRLPFDARTTSAFVEETGAFAAVNGDFFDPWKPGLLFGYPKPGDPVRTLGTTYAQGEMLVASSREHARLAVGPGGHAAFADEPSPGGDLLAGLCMVVEGGARADLAPCSTREPNFRHPRTAIGLDERRDTLFLVVVDGRQPRYSQGAELGELGDLLVQLGADAAMTVDGGGSSTLVARGADGAPEVLNRPIADRVPGRERPVANHLGVYFDP